MMLIKMSCIHRISDILKTFNTSDITTVFLSIETRKYLCHKEPRGLTVAARR
jgi:hypothetical protein